MRELSKKAARALMQGYFRLYPDEAAKRLDSLSSGEVLRFLHEEEPAVAAGLFLRLNPDTAAELAIPMEDALFQKIFSVIDPLKGSSLLARMDESAVSRRIELLPASLAREYRALMTWPADTAGSLMDPRTATFSAGDSVKDVLKRVRTIRDRRIMDVCIVDGDGRLAAVVPLQDIAVADPALPVGELVSGKPVSIQAMEPRQEVAKLLELGKLASLPVVDLDGKLLGVIRYDALVRAVEHEVSEDVMTMFGAGRDERALSKASFAVRKRLPWLHINLGTAFLAAAVVGLFEDTIARITVLAVFLPVVAGQSGNTGSQALAVTMRGLTLREILPSYWLRVARKEIAVGFINGCAIALITSLIVFVWASSAALAAVIGVSMVFSMVVAGVSGVVIPITLQKLGYDPAQSSAIVLTTVTDVVGFMSFLGLATILSGTLAGA